MGKEFFGFDELEKGFEEGRKIRMYLETFLGMCGHGWTRVGDLPGYRRQQR